MAVLPDLLFSSPTTLPAIFPFDLAGTCRPSALWCTMARHPSSATRCALTPNLYERVGQAAIRQRQLNTFAALSWLQVDVCSVSVNFWFITRRIEDLI